MSRRPPWPCLVAGVAFALCLPALGQTPGTVGKGTSEARPRQRVDINGDPLPEGAIARLGLGRLRHAGKAFSVMFSPDGKTLASGGEDRLIRLWDAATGKEVRQLAGHERDVTSVAFSPDGKTLASGSSDNTIRFWNLSTGKELPQIINHPGSVAVIAYFPDGKMLASGRNYEGDSVYLWETATGKEVRRWKAHQGGVCSLAFSPDGKGLATGGSPNDPDGKPVDKYALAVWDPATGKRRAACSGHTNLVQAAALSPDGKTLASVGFDSRRGRSLAFWETATGKEVRFLEGTVFDTEGLAFTPDGKTLAAADFFGINLWDVQGGIQLRPITITDDNARPLAIAFSPDGKTLASAGKGGLIGVWDVARRKERFDLPGHREDISSIAASPDGRTVVTGSFDGTARLWEWATGKPIRQFRDEQRPGGRVVWCVALSSDGKTLALSHREDAGVTLWDVATGKRLRRLTGQNDRLASIAFSPDGKTLLSEGSDDSSLHLWDVSSGREVRKFTTNQNRWWGAFSPDGQTIALVADGLYLWEASTGKRLHFLKDLGGELAFSPDGFLLAVVDDGVRLLDPVTAKEVGKYDAGVQAGQRHSLAFSPDGRWLAVASDTEIRLLEVATGRTRQKFRGHLGAVTCLAFSPDGNALISGSVDWTALVWDLRSLAEGEEKTTLKPEQLALLWDTLKGDDRLKAAAAASRLRRYPGQTLTLLQKQLRPAVVADPKRLTRLLTDLNSPRFQTRQEAARQLSELGDTAEMGLRRVLKDRPPLEVRKRVEAILEGLDYFERPRARWGIMFLERVGTPEARRHLEALAKGDSESRQSREAQAALKRLNGRASPPP